MAVSPTPPSISILPPAPLPTDAEAVFDAKAGVRLTAEEVMVTEQNAALAWQAGSMAETKGYKDAAETSASNAADSAILAGQQVGLAADQVALAAEQVELATTQANNAADSANSAQTYAQAAGAAVGPPPVANRFLGTDGAGIPSWKEVVIPPALKPGQILISASVPDGTHILANGATRSQADYPELHAALGPNAVTPPVTALALPSGAGGASCKLSPGAIYLAIGTSGTALNMFKRTGDVLASTQTITAPGSGVATPAFTSDSVYMAVPLSGAPYLAIYKRTGDAFNILANPATMPENVGIVARFSPDDVYLAVGYATGKDFIIYKRNGDVFTKLTDPAIMPGSTVYGLAFSPDGIYLAVGASGAPYLTIYKRAGDVFTKITGPATLPTSKVISLDYSPDGKALGMITNGNALGVNYVGMYRQDGDVFSVPTQSTVGVSAPSDCCFTPDGKYFAIANSTVRNAHLYPKVGDSLLPSPIVLDGFGNSIPGITSASSGATYMGTYLFLVGTSTSGWLRDGYPLNPTTEFKVPSLTITNGIAPTDTTTKFPYPQLTAYIKAKSSL